MKLLAAILTLVGWGAILTNGVGCVVRATKRVREVRAKRAKQQALGDYHRALGEHYERD